MLGLTCNLLWLIILSGKSFIFDLMQSRIKDFLLWKQASQLKQILWILLNMNETQGQIFHNSLSLYLSSNTAAVPSRLLKWWYHFCSFSFLQLVFIPPCWEVFLQVNSFIVGNFHVQETVNEKCVRHNHITIS